MNRLFWIRYRLLLKSQPFFLPFCDGVIIRLRFQSLISRSANCVPTAIEAVFWTVAPPTPKSTLR